MTQILVYHQDPRTQQTRGKESEETLGKTRRMMAGSASSEGGLLSPCSNSGKTSTGKRQLGSGGVGAHNSPGKTGQGREKNTGSKGSRTAGGPHSLQTGAVVPITSALMESGVGGCRCKSMRGLSHRTCDSAMTHAGESPGSIQQPQKRTWGQEAAALGGLRWVVGSVNRSCQAQGAGQVYSPGPGGR